MFNAQPTATVISRRSLCRSPALYLAIQQTVLAERLQTPSCRAHAFFIRSRSESVVHMLSSSDLGLNRPWFVHEMVTNGKLKDDNDLLLCSLSLTLFWGGGEVGGGVGWGVERGWIGGTEKGVVEGVTKYLRLCKVLNQMRGEVWCW